MKSMKNVLIVANSGMSNSGVPNVICQVIDVIHERCKVHLVVFNDDDFYYPFLKKRNVEIIKADILQPRSSIKKLYWHFIKYPRVLEKKISSIIKDKKIDIVHSFKEEEGWPILRAAKKLGVGLRIAHCNNEFRRRIGFAQQILAKRNQRKLLKYSNYNIGVCDRCCSTMFKKRESVVIYNSYNEARFNQRVASNLKDELVLTHIATFSPRKNQLFSIEILKSILSHGQQCKLNLVGFSLDDQYFRGMKQLIKDNKLEEHVSIIDGRNGTYAIYENTTFLLLPSISEGAPITLVEAQACGILCFVSSAITQEMNCGGVVYLPINDGPEIWAKTIEKSFAQHKNNRSNYDMQKFSAKAFSNSISEVYKL